MSPPSRGAWIEIEATTAKAAVTVVAPLAGGVDWNTPVADAAPLSPVAPLAGGVD